MDKLLQQREQLEKRRDSLPPQIKIMMQRVNEISIKDTAYNRLLHLRSNTRDFLVWMKEDISRKIILVSTRILAITREIKELERGSNQGH